MKLSEMSKNSKTQTNYTDDKRGSQKITEKYNELNDCSSDELMYRLSKEVEAQKQQGNFDYEGLLESIQKIKMYLPTQTYENMIRIIEQFK